MRAAIQLSREAIDGGAGGPFGAVIVRAGEVVGRGRNRVTLDNDPTAHAEVEAIRDACRALRTFRLDDCEIYSSCEPCPMCLAAIYWARLRGLYFANTRQDAAAIGFDDALIYEQVALPMDARKLVSRQMLAGEARVVFEQWKNKTDKIDY